MTADKKKMFDDVTKAIVRLPGKDGQGVLVSGNLILTAAHCIRWSNEAEMVLGDYFLEEIDTHAGRLKVGPLAVEPVADIAVLGELQDHLSEALAFEDFCDRTHAISVCQNDFELLRPFSIHIHTHKGTWINGTAMQSNPTARSLFIETSEQIEGGTSGGPIINDAGELVAIVSTFSDISDHSPTSTGSAPCPHLALPVWVCRQILQHIDE